MVTLIPALSAVLAVVGIVLLVRWTPEEVAQEVLQALKPRESLHTRGQKLRQHRQPKGLYRYLMQTKAALETTGRGKQFPVVLCVSLLLMVAGVVLSLWLGNPFLVPVATVAMALLPFLYVGNSMAQYRKHIHREMETTLSIITISYIRCDDILTAVEENLGYIKPPMQEMFRIFLREATLVSSDIKQALENLSMRIDDEIFHEWCQTLILCQEDRTLKDTLQPIVTKLTDIRLVNGELATMLSSVRAEYYTMAAMLVGNIPLLYVLNKDWFHTLMNTTPGKVVLAICGAVILITAFFMFRFTKPLEYKR